MKRKPALQRRFSKNNILEHFKFGAGYSSFRRVSLNRIRKEMNRYVINHEGSTTASDEYNEAMIIVIYLQVFVKKKKPHTSLIYYERNLLIG